jgi:hypothetical protein
MAARRTDVLDKSRVAQARCWFARDSQMGSFPRYNDC